MKTVIGIMFLLLLVFQRRRRRRCGRRLITAAAAATVTNCSTNAIDIDFAAVFDVVVFSANLHNSFAWNTKHTRIFFTDFGLWHYENSSFIMLNRNEQQISSDLKCIIANIR